MRVEYLGNVHYVYIYLDNRKPGRWEYKDWVFLYQPLYVGRGVYDRINDHVKPYERSKGTQKANTINVIIDKLKQDPIRHKIFEDLSYSESTGIEIDMISFFGRRNNGTGILANLTDGGEGSFGAVVSEDRKDEIRDQLMNNHPRWRGIYQKDLDGNLIKEWNSVVSIVRDLGLGKVEESRIKRMCLGTTKSKPFLGYLWEYAPVKPKEVKNIKNRKVYRYTLSGEYVDSFESIQAADRFMGKRSGVSRAILQNIPSSNFQWFKEYQGERIPPFETYRRIIRPLIRIDLEGNVIGEYQSIGHAVEETGFARMTIGGSIRKGARFADSYWEYKDSYAAKYEDRKVSQFSLSGEFISSFPSVKTAARSIGISEDTIRNSASGRSQSMGFNWKYDD